MPKLYYTATSCGAASFIAAVAAKVSLQSEQVNLMEHKTTSGVDFYTINPKGNVPTLVLDDGTMLNEGAATLQYIADQAPGTVAPLNGTKERYQVISALNLISSEIHPAIGFRFYPVPTGGELEAFREKRIQAKLTYLNDKELKGKSFLVGNSFTIADSYLYIVLSWLKPADFDAFPNVKAYFEGIKSLPVVMEAHAKMAFNPATTA